VAAAGFAQGRTGAHGGDDGGLDALDLCRGGCDLFGSLCRHDNDSVLVGAHHVAGADGDAIDEQRLLHRAYSHPILAGAHEPAGAPDPVVGGRRHRDVAAHPVDHGACGQHPRIDVVLRELDTQDAVRALAEHGIDVALVRRLATPPGIARRTLLEEKFVLAVPATWDHIPGDVVDLADTAREPWISLPRHISSDYHDQVVACCRQAGFSPMVTNTADSIVSQLAMVACDIGVAIVPDSAAEHGLNLHGRVRFVRIKKPTTIELAALWVEDTTNPAVAAFVRDRAPERS
jgi:LysR substrate binding domain-containing protein